MQSPSMKGEQKAHGLLFAEVLARLNFDFDLVLLCTLHLIVA